MELPTVLASTYLPPLGISTALKNLPRNTVWSVANAVLYVAMT